VKRLRTTFGSLRVRNFRIFFLVQLISLSGTWMQQVGQAWLVLRLTGSGVALGVTAALQFLPALFFASVGGLVADRADKRKLLMITQSAAGALALILAAVTLTGHVQLWVVWTLAFALGWVQVFDNPTRQSFITEMVGPSNVSNAISLNSAIFTSARVIGPAVAGLVIAWVGTGWCFLYNGLSFFPVVGGLMLMRPEELIRSAPLRRARGQLMEGLRYTWSRPELRLTLMLIAVIGTLAFNFNVLLPLMASKVFHGDAGTFGAMLSLMGVGSLAGALLSAARRSPTHRLLAGAAVLFGMLLTAAALMPTLPLELAVLVPMGVCMVTVQAAGNTLLQLNSDPAFRGRVMALYVTVFVGTTPIGGPIIGFVAEHLGPRVGMAIGGVSTVAAAVWVLWAIRHGVPAARQRAVAPDAAPAMPAEPAH
jgi:predicted MFS family arabinose efflux permease